MYELEGVSFTYAHAAPECGISDIDLRIPDGQAVLVCGESGCGKTTLLRLLNGLIPSYYEGELSGSVRLDGREVPEMELHELAPIVGSVFQNPKSQFFTVNSTSEIAFGCENLGLSVSEIADRVRGCVTEFDMEGLLDCSLFALSGGEKQKVACASVSAMAPRVLILDEPTSNLDFGSIEDMRRILASWKAKGRTIVVSEHRLSWLMDIVDRVVYLRMGKVELDLSVEELCSLGPAEIKGLGLRPLDGSVACGWKEDEDFPVEHRKDQATLRLDGFSFAYKRQKGRALDIEDLEIPAGEIVGIVGRNGAGKSTFARCLCGLESHASGMLEIAGESLGAKARLRRGYMVMQDVNHQLFTESVLEEVVLGIEVGSRQEKEGRAEEILRSLDLGDKCDLHPMSLSGGERQRVAIAGAVASSRDVVVFDEPTSGLDFGHMIEVAEAMESVRRRGASIFVITHDTDLMRRVCTYLVCLEDGRVSWQSYVNYEALEKLEHLFEKMRREVYAQDRRSLGAADGLRQSRIPGERVPICVHTGDRAEGRDKPESGLYQVRR